MYRTLRTYKERSAHTRVTHLHAELSELVSVLYRVLHSLLQLTLDILKASNVFPTDIGHLHKGLTQCAGVAVLQRVLEVVIRYSLL
jgi:hypothetical protein